MENNYNSSFLLENRAHRITIPLTTILCLISLLIIEHFVKEDMYIRHWLFHKTQCYMEIVPVMLLTFLSGYAMGGLVVLCFFAIECILSHQLIYHAFVLLIAALITNIPVDKHWFKNLNNL